MFDYSFKLSREDIYAFNIHFNHHSPSAKRLIWVQRIAIVLVFGGGGMYSALTSSNPAFSILIFGVLLFFWLFRINASIKGQVKRGIKRVEKEGKLYEEELLTYRFEENTFTRIAKNQRTESAYKELARVDAGEKGVYLFVGAEYAHIFPNAVFAGEKEKEHFVAFVRQKIEGSRRNPSG